MMTNLLQTLAKATGFTLGQEVNLWYSLHKSLQVLCAKLDDDGGVTDTDYEALCWTAIVNTVITDTIGNRVGLRSADEGFFSISPTGITNRARHWMMYNYISAWKTLCAKLDDDDTVTDTTYEALCYTALFLHIVKDPKGVTDLGNGTVYYFTPGASDHKQLIEWFYNALNALETLTEQLDADGGVTDEDYEALTYTAYCDTRVENAAGNILGN